MQIHASSMALWAVAIVNYAAAQCLNEVANFNPNLRTMTSNNTYFIVPVPSAAVQTAINEAYPQLLPSEKLSLLPVPSTDTTLFPSGFPAGHHPIYVTSGISCDIRMAVAQIQGCLKLTSIYAPYVSRGGSPTPFGALLSNYLGGTDEQTIRQISALIPNIASTVLEGFASRQGTFTPINAAWQTDSNGLSSQAGRWAIAENPVSGPGVVVEAADLFFTSTRTPKVTPKLVKAALNQPVVLNGLFTGQCARNTYYFTNATAQVEMRTGNVTLGPAASGNGLNLGATPSTLQQASPDGFGNYFGVDGITGCAQVLGSMPEECETAARNVDPASL